MKKLDIVITMGGLGKRFRDAGYRVPKYMIEAKGKTLFEWSLLSLRGYADAAERYVFIAMKDSEVDVEAFIKRKCMEMGLSQYHVILLDYLTDGQATTAMLAKRYWSEKNGLLIYNIDTYVEPGEMKAEELRGDGFIPCFRAEGTHWSFVRLDPATGKAVEIKEKERISSNCTLGAYYFSSCALYSQLYKEYYSEGKHLVKGEKYVAPLYDYLLTKGGSIYISDIDPAKVHVLGTPEELQAFLREA